MVIIHTISVLVHPTTMQIDRLSLKIQIYSEEVLAVLKSKQHPVGSCLFVHDHEKNGSRVQHFKAK